MNIRCDPFKQGAHKIVVQNCQELRIIRKCFIEEVALHWKLVHYFRGMEKRKENPGTEKDNKQRHRNVKEQNTFRGSQVMWLSVKYNGNDSEK